MVVAHAAEVEAAHAAVVSHEVAHADESALVDDAASVALDGAAEYVVAPGDAAAVVEQVECEYQCPVQALASAEPR
jgi:hypothetical protein